MCEINFTLLGMSKVGVNVHLVVPRCTANTSELLRIHGQGVLTVRLQHWERLLVVDLPHPVRVAWDPDFWEGNELASCCAGFIDEVNGLLNAGFEVEPAWLGGDL